MKFNFDNPFFHALGKLVDSIWVSILWLLCCIPIITIGAATTALYYTVHKSIRGGRGYTARNFFKSLKENFKPSTLSWLAVLAVWLVLAGDIAITHKVLMSGSNMGMFFYFFLFALVFAVGWACYVFPYIARFANTVKGTLQNGLFMELKHLPWSMLLVVLLVAAILLAWFIPPLIFLLPSVTALMFDLILERIFQKYMSPEDLEKELENNQMDDV